MLYSSAKRIHGYGFVCYVKANDLAIARLGVVIANRNQKLAVYRNQFRRIVRESFRHHQKLLGGLDIIIVARKEINSLSKADLRQEIDRKLEKLKR